MQSENRENISATEIVRVQEGVEQAKAEAKQARVEVGKNQNGLRLHISKTKTLWAVVVLLAVALAGASWYGYPKLMEHSAQIDQLPGMQDLIDEAYDRIGAAEEMMSAIADETLSAVATEQDNVTKRLAKLEGSFSANLRIAQDQARQVFTQVEQRLRTELSQGIEAMQAGLANMQSAQDADRAKLVQLQNEMISVRDQVASARREAAEQAAMVREETLRAFSQRDHQLASNRTDIDALAGRLDRRRIDFELPVHRTEELTPNLYLTVSEAMVSHQRIDGWLQLDGRILWLRGQGIQQPIVFYTQNDARTHEIVLTRVKDNEVAGYLLVPYETAVAAGESQAGQLSRNVSAE